jgi:hypothetical protein
MLLAMQASRLCPPRCITNVSTSTCIAGERVAQLMKSRFFAWWRRLVVPVAEKIWRIAVSSDTTVKIVLASSATRAGFAAASQPSSVATSVAVA